MEINDIINSANVEITILNISPKTAKLFVEVRDITGTTFIREPDPTKDELTVFIADVSVGPATAAIRTTAENGSYLQCQCHSFYVGMTRIHVVVELKDDNTQNCATNFTCNIPCIAEVSSENSVTLCRDGIDNDCDNTTDCEDPDCNTIKRTCYNGQCSGVENWDCNTNTYMSCNAPEPIPEQGNILCNDGKDNDCNGLTDCDDSSCIGAIRTCMNGNCEGTQVCQGSGWGPCNASVPIPENNLNVCHDDIDNDCDSYTDCEDPDCQSCGGCGCSG